MNCCACAWKSLLELSESGFSSLIKTGSMILLIIFKWHPSKDRNTSMEELKRPLRVFIKKEKNLISPSWDIQYCVTVLEHFCYILHQDDHTLLQWYGRVGSGEANLCSIKCFSVQVCFHCIDNVFGIIVITEKLSCSSIRCFPDGIA